MPGVSCLKAFGRKSFNYAQPESEAVAIRSSATRYRLGFMHTRRLRGEKPACEDTR